MQAKMKEYLINSLRSPQLIPIMQPYRLPLEHSLHTCRQLYPTIHTLHPTQHTYITLQKQI